jgi:probable HAF family extracellular repeat protein
MGINDSGTAIVGLYEPSGSKMVGFLYQNQTLQSLRLPMSTLTSATGVNNSGEVVGWFEDAHQILHGFLWTPPADAGKK